MLPGANRPRAVVLFSGGLDSATVLSIAKRDYECYALSFHYGQRHTAELNAARQLARALGVEHRVMSIDFAGIGGSALTDVDVAVPDAGTDPDKIPVTYVPARNTVFLSLALAWAEVLDAAAIHIGVNAVDYSGYPDCRPEFINAFQSLAKLATRQGVTGESVKVLAPLINWSKAEIIKKGCELGVDYAATVSCYQADEGGRACGRCDACALRRQGFIEAQLADPTRYR